MRILLSTSSLLGHLNPTVAFALTARDAGHDVVVATGPDRAAHVVAHGLRHRAAGPSAEASPASDWLSYFTEASRRRAADLVPFAVDWGPDLVIAEETDLAGPVAAQASGARLAVHGLGLMPPRPVWDMYAAGVHDLGRRWEVSCDADVLRAAPYLEVSPPLLRPGGDRPWPRALPTRPTLPRAESDTAVPDPLPHPDTVHLTLGTVFHGHHAVLRTALLGLSQLPVNVVVAVGPGVDPAVLGPQPSHVLVEQLVAYPQLMPRCRLVVSQGGYGVLLAGLSHGVAQLLLPQGADQFRNAEACRAVGAGDVLSADVLTAEAVRDAAARLLEEPSYAVAARAVQDEISAMPDLEEVLAALVGPTGDGRTAEPVSVMGG